MVHWWFGARWFGFLGSPYEKGLLLRVPLESQATGPQTTKLPLVESTSSRPKRASRWVLNLLLQSSMKLPLEDPNVVQKHLIFFGICKKSGAIVFCLFFLRRKSKLGRKKKAKQLQHDGFWRRNPFNYGVILSIYVKFQQGIISKHVQTRPKRNWKVLKKKHKA